MNLKPIAFRSITADHGELYALSSDGTVYRYIRPSWTEAEAESEGRKSKRPADAHWFPMTNLAVDHGP